MTRRIPIHLKSEKKAPLSVSQLTGHIKGALQESIGRLWVFGEISGFNPARSGHWYFSLKDSYSLIRVNMWKSTTSRVDFLPSDGQEVLIYGQLNLYAPRGEYNVIAEWMEPLGAGKQFADLERLKEKLREEGLFDSRHKKALPLFPSRIGIVTSQTGAALQDIRKVLKHRLPGLTLVISDSAVQGETASSTLVNALENLDRHGFCDLIILARGGGAESDLAAFNDENLVRTVFQAQTPIITGIGHETDLTLCDLVSDVRAATPSHAAEMAVLTRHEYLDMVKNAVSNLRGKVEKHLQDRSRDIHNLNRQGVFHRLWVALNQRKETIQRQVNALETGINSLMSLASSQLIEKRTSLASTRVTNQIHKNLRKVAELEDRLDHLTFQHVEKKKTSFHSAITKLEALSPLAVFSRGYAVLRDANKDVVKRVDQVQVGQKLEGLFFEGTLELKVLGIKKKNN